MTAIEWIVDQMLKQGYFYNNLTLTYTMLDHLQQQAKEMEKQQIIDAGNSCAIKQHMHNDEVDKMSNYEAMIFTQTDNLTFGEQYYNETFNLSQQEKP
jgi:hypothetical protein